MLQVIGDKGKSVIADAIQKYDNARIYVYDKEPVQTLDSCFISSKHFSVEEFCESVGRDIEGLGYDYLPINTVVLYTNSPDINVIVDIRDYAKTLEEKHMASTVIVMAKMSTM